MVWKTRVVTKYSPSGIPYKSTEQYWQMDFYASMGAAKKPVYGPAARMPTAAEAKANAKIRANALANAKKREAAARLAAANAKALASSKALAAKMTEAKEKEYARVQMWKNLQEKAKLARDKIAPPTQGVKKPLVKPGDPKFIGPLTTAGNAKQQAAAEAIRKNAEMNAAKPKIAAARSMTPQEELRLEKLYRNNPAQFAAEMRKRKDRLDLETARSTSGSKQSNTTLARLIKEAQARQKSSGGKDLDGKYVTEVTRELERSAEEAKRRLTRHATAIQELMLFKRDGTFKGWKGGEAGFKKYKEIVESKDFKRAVAAHDDLFKSPIDKKTGKPIRDSNFSQAMSAVDQISASQREYIRGVAKDAFFKGTKGREDYLSRNEEWNNSERWKYIVDVTDIDPLTTTWDTSKKRRRTVQEEFDYRKGQYEAEIKRRMTEEANKFNAGARNEEAWAARAEWSQASGGMMNSAAQNRTVQLMADAAQRVDPSNGGKGKWFEERGNIDRTVDEALRAWEAENKRWFQSKNLDPKLRGVVDGMSRPNYLKYQRARDEARKNFYAAVHASPTTFIDQIAGSPINVVTTPLASVMSGIGGLIPGGLRAGLQMTTGSSTINLPINSGDLPTSVSADIKRRAARDARAGITTAAGYRGAPGRQSQLERQYMQEWLASPEGKKWNSEFNAARKAKSDAELVKFLKVMYPKEAGVPEGERSDVWQKLNALGEFGAEPTTNAALNLAMGIGLDPTIALPLKFTTWGARWAHAAEAANSTNKIKRLGEGFIAFQKVTEPELRFNKMMNPIIKDIAAGADPKIFTEQVLQTLAGIKDGPQRKKAAEEFLRSIGVNPRTTNGHAMLTATQEAVVAKLEKLGVDYEDVLSKAKKAEGVKAAEEEAIRVADLKKAIEVDRAAKVREAAAAAEGKAVRVKLAAEKEAELVAERAKVELAKIEPPPLAKVEPAPLAQNVHAPTGMAEPSVLKARAADPIRAAVTSLREAVTAGARDSAGARLAARKYGVQGVSDAEGDAATVMHAITGSQDVVYHEGAQFAPGPYTDTFLASDEYAEAKHILALPEPTPTHIRPTPGEAAVRAAEKEEREAARRLVYEAGRESIAIQKRELEGLARTGERPLINGQVPYQRGYGGKSYVVVGGRQSGQQYIASTSDLMLRSGVDSPAAELAMTQVRSGIEAVRKKLVKANRLREGGRITEEQFLTELDEIRRIGVDRRNADVTVDMRSGDGMLVSISSSELDHVRAGTHSRYFIPVGDALVEDFLSMGHIGQYYESFSLLPEMMRGPGYETALMGNILDPHWRAGLDSNGFLTQVIEKFQMHADLTPAQFRQEGAHLFALFHLTALDADDALAEIADLRKMLQRREIDQAGFDAGVKAAHAKSNGAIDRLYEYGLAMDAVIDADPSNIYARMWKVMESRTGVWWAEDFAVSEGLFVSSILKFGTNLHPNLALGMIPYGPIARHTPISHGFVGHLRNLATTTNKMFKASPTRWTDDVVVDIAFGQLASRRLTAAEGVTVASQISHYVASRYGNTLRRSRFRTVLADHSIEAIGTFRRTGPSADYAYQSMRSKYIEMEHLLRGDAGFVTPENAAKYGKAFDEQFTAPIRPPLKRRQFNEVTQRIFDEMYWDNVVTHDNPALHTARLFEVLGDPKLQRGDSWLKYANSYWGHMVASGATDEARVVLRELFQQRVNQSALDAYEALTKRFRSASPEKNVWRGGVNEFFIRSGLLKDARRVVAEGDQRVLQEEHLAQMESDLAAIRNDLEIEDDVLREKQRAFKSDSDAAAMYDGATVEHLADAAVRASDEVTAAERDLRKLATGKTVFDEAVQAMEKAEQRYADAGVRVRAKGTDPGAMTEFRRATAARNRAVAKAQRLARQMQTDDLTVEARRVVAVGPKRPSEARMKAYHRTYRGLLYNPAKGRKAANAFLEGLPDDAVMWMRAEVRRDDALREMTKLFNSVVYRTRDLGALPVHVGEQMLELVRIAKTMPNGEAFLRNFAEVYYKDLFASRLLDYIKHEPWFVWKGAEAAGVSQVVDLTKQMTGLTKKMSDVRESLRLLTRADEGKRAGLEARLADLEADHAALKAERDDAIAARAAPEPEAAAPGAAAPPPESDIAQRRQQYVDAIAAVQRGETVLDPDTGEPLVALTKEHALKSLRQRMNALGGEPAAGAPPPRPPSEPTRDQLNNPRVAAMQRGLEILEQKSEKQWLNDELLKAQRAHRTAKDGVERGRAINRIRDIRKAFKVIEIAETGKGRFITPKGRRAYVTGVLSTVGDRAKGVIAPKMITSYVVNAAGLEVEQGRSLNMALRNVQVSTSLRSEVRQVGDVSSSYTKHGAQVESAMSVPLSPAFLAKHGLPDEMGDLTVAEIVTNLDEFSRSIKGLDAFIVDLTNHVDVRLQQITRDKTYNVEQWLDDRLLVRSDHFDSRLFERIEQQVSDAIAAERQGFRRGTRTDLRRPMGKYANDPLAEMIETDVRAVRAKARVLASLGVDPHAYNEARKVLRTPLLRKRYGQQIVAGATEAAERTLKGMGKKKGDSDYDRLFREEYDKEFDIRRTKLADEEAIKLLDQLAWEMHGALHMEVIAEFEKRYGMDFEVRGGGQATVTPFQKRTLEEAVKTHLGVTDLDDAMQMTAGLRRHGQHPPFDDRAKMVDWLTKYGFWSKRTGQQIATSGAKSWDIFTEAKYYKDAFGSAPPWADPDLLEEGGDLHHILHNEAERGSQYRAWGLFNRNMEARFASGNMTREERARFLVEGSEELGIKAKRDLAMERQYVLDRYGRLVSDDGGKTLTKGFPELMHRDELRQYIITQSKKPGGVPDDIFQTVEELELYHKILDLHVGEMVDGKFLKGEVVGFDDVFAMSANIVHDMMLHPIWAERGVDAVGKFVRSQAAIRRAFIFTNPAFAGTNIVDSAIKGSWSRFKTRSFHKGPISETAMNADLRFFGFEPHGQLLRDTPVAGWDRVRAAKARGKRAYMDPETGKVRLETDAEKRIADGLQTVLAVTELPAKGANRAENTMKLRLAQSMYDESYRRALARVGGDEKLADALARKFVHDEVSRLWPTVGDGPIEQLFNQLFPFMSYQFKNRVLWLGEMASNPAVFNYLNKIGDYIEQSNRERWRREGTENQHTDVEARQIELPWAKGVFLDVGAWTDAQAGLKPLYDIVNGKATVGSLTSQFVRLVSANELNMFYGILNAMDWGQRLEWVQGIDKNGFPDGKWSQVEIPWEAPWGGEANALNSFWPTEMFKRLHDAGLDGKFTMEEATQLVYHVAFFGGMTQNDPAKGLQSFYFTLKEKNPLAAKEWLTTAEGRSLQMYWADKAPKTQNFNAQAVTDLLYPRPDDRNPWLHEQDKDLQARIGKGFEDLRNINTKWDAVLWELTPGTQAFRDAKLSRSIERFNYYRDHPWMYDYEAGSLTPAKWAEQLDYWRTDDLVDGFFALKIPVQKENESAKHYQARLAEWRTQRTAYLKAFPTVAERLASSRTSVEAVWKQTEEHWFEVLDKVGTRSIAIEAAKAAKNYPLIDQLYLANDLDFAQLDVDTAVDYWNPSTDLEPLQKDVYSVAGLRQGGFGQPLLKRVKVLPDFNKWRYDRADAAGKAKIERDNRYGEGMKDVIAAAKKSDNFGATFVRELKKDPFLLNEYFKRNPGKREKWATNDAYINIIGKFGRLMKAGKFDEGYAYFDRMPDWVKDKYYNNHPEKRRKRQGSVENLQYLNYMKRWTAHYKKRDYEGGAKFFDSMPKWVKDRYYAKHPQGFGRGESGGYGSSPYSKAMGKWVKLLQEGHKDEARAWFDSMPQAYRDRYYAGHPEAKLRDDIKRTGQLGQYFAADDANRTQYLKDNPEFAKWLAKQGDSAQTRRMLITAAYRALPKGTDGAWMRRMYREKYPEIFSKEAVGVQALKKVYADLVEHPELNAGFEKWLAIVWATYAENMKHTVSRPKPLEVIHPRQHGSDRATPHQGKSAAWVRLHSLS